MEIQENIALAPLTTFQVGGPARYFIEAHAEHEVMEAVAFALARHLPLFVLGGGSNLVVADEGWPGLVLKVSLRGVEFEGDLEKMLFCAGAGENWDDLVALAVATLFERMGCCAVGFVGNDWDRAALFEPRPELVAVIGLIGQDLPGALEADNKGMAALQSALFPGVSKKLTGRPLASVTAWILLVRPPRLWPMACAPSPF